MDSEHLEHLQKVLEVQAAIEEGVPSNVLGAALFARFASRGQADFSNRVLSAMRAGFGGHFENAGK